MKILLVNKFFYLKGGSEKYMFSLAEAFKAKGHEVIFFCMQDEKNGECSTSKYFVRKRTADAGFKGKLDLALHIAYSKEAYKKMTDLLIVEKPDLIVLNLVHKQLTCSIIDAVKDYNSKLPIIWVMHDLVCACPAYVMLDGNNQICEKCLGGNFTQCKKNKCVHGSRLMSNLSSKEAKIIKKRRWYDKVDLYITPSNFYKNKLLEAKFTRKPIVWMRNPLPIDTNFELCDKDDGYILFFGRLSIEKGIKTLIDSMKNIKYRLVVLGTGPLEKELKNYVLNNNISNVELLGFKSGNELTNYIKNSRCVVLPSEWYENGPYSAMESMALGKPLIVSNNGGLPELVEDGANGYVFKSEEELINCINKMISLSDDEYRSMCELSLKLAKDYFDYDNYIDGLLTLATAIEPDIVIKHKFINKVISRIKGERYIVDDGIPESQLFSLCIRKLIELLRGFFIRIHFTKKHKGKNFFVGKNVRIRCKSRIACGSGVSIADGVYIDACCRGGVLIGNNVSIGRNTQIECTGVIRELGESLIIEDGVGIGANCFIGVRGKVIIGKNTIIDPNVKIHSENHIFSDIGTPIRLQGTSRKGIVIGEDCWIGSGAIILDGVHIGKGCVIAAGAVVNKDISDYTVSGGVPVKTIKTRI